MAQFHNRWLTCVLLATATGLAFAQDDADEVIEEEISTDAPPPEPACFSVRDINNFDPLNDSFVYVSGRRDQHYLLTMQHACFGLRNARGIAISNQMNRIGSNSFGEISYRDVDTVVKCGIRQIEAVVDKDAARALVERRKDQQ